MYVIALRTLPPPDPPRVQALAVALGTTAYEARARLLIPSGGPALVARLADGAAAASLGAALSKAGFSPLVIDAAEVETAEQRFGVRRLGFGAAHLEVTDRGGTQRQVPFAHVRLILRATGISFGMATDTDTRRKFSAGRALVSGGLLLTKKTTTTTTRTTEDWQACLVVYLASGPALLIEEAETLYEGSDHPTQPTRQATFMHILERLRTSCPQAAYDDQLMRRAGQLQLLGPSLNPEESLDIALAVLAARYGVEGKS